MAKLVLTSRPLRPGEFTGDPTREQYAAIGEFISNCSLLEVTMHVLLRHWLGIDEHIARGLVGEPRTKDLIDLLRFAYASQSSFKASDETADLLATIYAKAMYINDVRAVVAHKPCLTDGTSLMFHNAMTYKRKTSEFKYECTAVQLTNLAEFTLGLASSVGLLPILPQRRFVQRCTELLSSSEKLDLPSPPLRMTQRTERTPTRQRPLPSSPE